MFSFFFFQAEDGIRDYKVTGVQTCALPIYRHGRLGRNSLGRGRQDYEAKDSTRGNESEGKVCKRVAEVSRVGYLTFLQISPNTHSVLPQEPVEIGVSKRRLEQVRPDSAFWS